MSFFLSDSTERAYLPFIPRLTNKNIVATGDDHSQRVFNITFPFGDSTFEELYVCTH